MAPMLTSTLQVGEKAQRLTVTFGTPGKARLGPAVGPPAEQFLLPPVITAAQGGKF